jgi:hypothetical protein
MPHHPDYSFRIKGLIIHQTSTNRMNIKVFFNRIAKKQTIELAALDGRRSAIPADGLWFDE